MRKCPFGVAGQYVGPWFVGSMCEASNSERRVPSGSHVRAMWQPCERDVFLLLAEGSLTLSVLLKGTRKIVLERKKELMRSAS